MKLIILLTSFALDETSHPLLWQLSAAILNLDKVLYFSRLNMSQEMQHGGKREGAGRPKGSLNKRSLKAIEQVEALYPGWTPLLHLATVANDSTLDVEIRLDAAKAAAPYFHAKLKSVDEDPDATVELETRIHAAKLDVAESKFIERPGLVNLAERLERASGRQEAV